MWCVFSRTVQTYLNFNLVSLLFSHIRFKSDFIIVWEGMPQIQTRPNTDQTQMNSIRLSNNYPEPTWDLQEIKQVYFKSTLASTVLLVLLLTGCLVS